MARWLAANLLSSLTRATVFLVSALVCVSLISILRYVIRVTSLPWGIFWFLVMLAVAGAGFVAMFGLSSDVAKKVYRKIY
jgi:hypothetical protein